MSSARFMGIVLFWFGVFGNSNKGMDKKLFFFKVEKIVVQLGCDSASETSLPALPPAGATSDASVGWHWS